MELIDVPGIGEKTVAAFNKAGIESISDLLKTYPRTYRTYHATSCLEASVGDWVILSGQIKKPSSHHTGRISTQIASFVDHSGRLTLRWFNMPFIARSIDLTATYQVMGKIEVYNGLKQIVSPSIKKLADTTEVLDAMVPIYRQMGSLKPWILRTKIQAVLDHLNVISDTLSLDLLSKYHLLDYQSAINLIHKPTGSNELEEAIHRLSWQELYDLQLESLSKKRAHAKSGLKFNVDNKLLSKFISDLPFILTSSQKNAVDTLLAKLSSGTAMQALLQGEVGSGKTAVAAALAYATFTAGYRTIILAPTEILASQLYSSISSYLPSTVTSSLITAGSKGSPESNLIVGTHALLNKKFEKVGLVIVDEQHRFGVEQREKLVNNKYAPHLLMMTATPIPRSLAMTIFSYLDIVKLDGTPPGRLPTKTFYVDERKRDDSYAWIKKELRSGNQVFMVTPLIELAEEEDETPLKSVQELENSLKKHFVGIPIDIMHGKMKSTEKQERMDKFKAGITQILVATSMIEVGIDVPEANIMVIENAERFGLAQLHQLRGRVGRGGKQGYCLLFSSSKTEKARDRLAFFVRTIDGEKLAKYDLASRGPGELFGTSQSGFFNLAVGSMFDEKMLSETAEAAKDFIGIKS